MGNPLFLSVKNSHAISRSAPVAHLQDLDPMLLLVFWKFSARAWPGPSLIPGGSWPAAAGAHRATAHPAAVSAATSAARLFRRNAEALAASASDVLPTGGDKRSSIQASRSRSV